jgi:hypothetical protein
MINFIKKLFGAKPAETVAEVPYKIEAAVVESKPTQVAEKATEAAVASIAKPAPKKQASKKPGAPKKQGNYKPRKPKAPKAPKV